MKGLLVIGCKLSFSTFGVLTRWSILKVSTLVSLGFGPVSLYRGSFKGSLNFKGSFNLRVLTIKALSLLTVFHTLSTEIS